MLVDEAAVFTLARSIGPLDEAAMAAARERQAGLVKPPGSLGRLEELAIQVAGITGRPRPARQRKVVLVFAGDHGVTREGVSAYPSAVTPLMVEVFVRGVAAVSVLVRGVGARLHIIDVGVDAEFPPGLPIIHRKVQRGTASFVDGPAMERETAVAALSVGAEVVGDEVARGVDLLALGEMGIGNTTAAAALAAAILDVDPERVVGRGTGLDDAGVRRKVEVVRRALGVNHPSTADPIGALAAVGGLEIAALVGAVLQAAAARIPILLDGYIGGVAALVACRIAPAAKPYLIAAHRSAEPGHQLVLAELGLNPLFDLGMRLGEASGATVALAIVEAALATHDDMTTLAEVGITSNE
jgi:nicotinate-nucleotide--dimethylbenzimidazole phosphoribosyltransferase